MKIKWTFSNGLVGCRIEGELDLEDDMTDDEIDEAVSDTIMENYVEISWEQCP